jgi:hypothetical protein
MGTNGLWVIRLGKHYDETRGQGFVCPDCANLLSLLLSSAAAGNCRRGAFGSMFRGCIRGREGVKESLYNCRLHFHVTWLPTGRCDMMQ